jgi:hypothetical protein
VGRKETAAPLWMRGVEGREKNLLFFFERNEEDEKKEKEKRQAGRETASHLCDFVAAFRDAKGIKGFV